jgi:hypothetical protein
MPSTYQALPLPPSLTTLRPAMVPAYPEARSTPPEPLRLPWPLKPLGSADSGIDQLADGRLRCWIRHEVLHGVTPRMLAWWFAHLEGDVEISGQRIARYRLWHPFDHVHAGYARRLPDGSVGPGAVLRIKEFLGGDPRFLVDVHSEIEKLDEEGFIHNPILHGVRGLARMEYTFRAVPGGTFYENCLIFGPGPAWGRAGRWLQPLAQRLAFPPGKGDAWLRHNIEEVGMFERFLPALYAQENLNEIGI